MIQFKIKQIKGAKMVASGKFYALASHETLEFKDFIAHMAGHHCAFSEATIQGVLIFQFHKGTIKTMRLISQMIRFSISIP